MANKCLVTTLEGSVNNENLLKYGELEFELKQLTSPTQNQVKLSVSNIEHISCLNGAKFVTDYNDINDSSKYLTELDNPSTVYFVNESGICRIKSKYNLATFLLPQMSSKTSHIINMNIDNLIFSKKIYSFRVCFNTLSGDFAKLGNLPLLMVSNEVFDISYSEVRGNYEEYVSTAVSIGKTSGETKVKGINRVLFGGVSVIGLGGSNLGNCVWSEGGSKMAIYGTTNVITKGYSAVEAAAAFPDLTVERIEDRNSE